MSISKKYIRSKTLLYFVDAAGVVSLAHTLVVDEAVEHDQR